MDEYLEKIHAHINDLLKFAEAKSVGLIAFNSLVVMEIIKFYLEGDECFLLWKFFVLMYVGILNVISFIMCILSIIPNQKITVHKHYTSKSENLLFYGKIASLTPTEYFDEAQAKYELVFSNKNYCIDKIKQLIIQSQILVNKFRIFKIASIVTMCSIVSPIGYLVFWFNRNKWK